jgi:uncharacterized Zn finger protein
MVISLSKTMYLKCPSCKERRVLEEQLARLEWRRMCIGCGFVYKITAEVEQRDLDTALLAELASYQLSLDG